MYIPKNRILTNQFSNDRKLVYKSSQEFYVGFYYKTFNGKYFTGKTQNDPPNVELEVVEDTFTSYSPTIPQNEIAYIDAPTIFDDINTPGYSEEMVITYARLQNINLNQSTRKFLPYQSYPTPTEDDYLLGSFTRYFAVKVNELQYLELDLPTFQKLKKRDVGWKWRMYIIFSIQWTLTGDQEEVARTNKNQILIAEQNINRLGLSIFLKRNYLKFYKYKEQTSLFTKGGEYINRATGQEYIGYYHIHSLKGPMVGQFHTSINHNYLDPIIITTSIKTTDSPITGSTSSSTNGSYSSPSGGGY